MRAVCDMPGTLPGFIAGARNGARTVLLGLSLAGCISTAPDPEHMARIDAWVAERVGTPFHTAEILEASPDGGAPGADGELTMDAAVARALARNFSLVAQAESVAIAQAQLAQAGLLPNPSVGLSVRHPHPAGLLDVDLNLTQQLNGLFTHASRVDVGLHQRLQSGLDLAALAFDVSQQVELKYRSLAHLMRTKTLSGKIVAQYDRAVKAAEARAKVGVIPTPDVNRARLQWENARRQMRKIDAQVRRTARELNWLMGDSTPPAWRLPAEASEIPRDLPPLPSAEGAEALGRRFRLDLRRAELDLRVGEANVRVARWGLIPGLTAGVDRERDFDGTVKTGGTLGITLPIFDPGWVSYQLAQAQLRLFQKSFAALERQVSRDVRSAYTTVELDLDDVRFYRDTIIPQQEENIRLAEISFRLGNTDLDSLLNVLRDYVDALQGYEDSIETCYEDVVALQRAVGLVWTRMLEEERKPPEEKP